MKITVGIPVFNRVNTIESCINSVLHQETDADFEILVVDNHSNDGTKVLLDKYADNEKISVIFNNENIGLADNWSKVFRSASGDFIYLLHSDDLMLQGTIEAVEVFLKSHPLVDFAFGNVTVSRGNKIQKNVFKKRKRTGYLDNKWLLDKYYYKGLHPAPPQTWIVKKGIIDLMGGFVKNNICCDFNMSFKVVASNFKIGYLNRCLAVWVLHNDNIGGGEMEKHKSALMAAIKDIQDEAGELGLDVHKLSQIEVYVSKQHAFELLKKGDDKKAIKLGRPKRLRPISSHIDLLILLFFGLKINLIKPLFKLKNSIRPLLNL